MSDVSQETMMFRSRKDRAPIERTIQEVCAALRAKGYNPVEQLVGYLLSGEPTYITSYQDARNKVRRYERYELLEELVKNYLEQVKG